MSWFRRILALRGVTIDGIRLDPARTKIVYRAAAARSLRSSARWRWFPLVGGIGGVVIIAGWWLGTLAFTSPQWALPLGMMVGLIMGAAIALGLKYGFLLFFRRELRQAMRRMGYLVCPNCGYGLEGLDQAGACPECGAPLDGKW